MAITLKAARVNANLTQDQAAEKLDISKFTLGNYENGKTRPNEAVIKKMIVLYKTPYDQLIFPDRNNDNK